MMNHRWWRNEDKHLKQVAFGLFFLISHCLPKGVCFDAFNLKYLSELLPWHRKPTLDTPTPFDAFWSQNPRRHSHIVISCLVLSWLLNMQQSVNTRPNILTRSEGWKRLMTHSFCPITCSTRLKKLDFPPPLTCHMIMSIKSLNKTKNKHFMSRFLMILVLFHTIDVRESSFLLPVKIWPSNPVLKTQFQLGGGSKLSSRSSPLTQRCTHCIVGC